MKIETQPKQNVPKNPLACRANVEYSTVVQGNTAVSEVVFDCLNCPRGWRKTLKATPQEADSHVARFVKVFVGESCGNVLKIGRTAADITPDLMPTIVEKPLA